jgi:hypothetical protein
VNLFKQLFSRHRQSAVSAPPTTWLWLGKSGASYEYDIHPLETEFRSLPGNYIYARQLEDGGWEPIYIAQTRDLHQRLEGHVRLEDAVAQGATHLHAHYCTRGQAARCSEEHDLVRRWRPVCNDPLED